MFEILKKFEKVMIVSLIIMMTTVLFLSIIELGWIIGKDIITEPVLLLEITELLEIFGLFLLVLIGIELLDSIKTYITENVIHVEVVLIVAIIAIARKVIILDIDKYPPMTFVGIATIILALAIAFYLVKKVHWDRQKTIEIPKPHSILP
ncbi:MAG: phosphate-starvation-inducible PsiE family protein [bacterium]|jgi:uncharacterized membrane protein (DUF373 family)|nr:phosphate-starvation-inducible PsiE family protein [bacterium]